MTGIPYTVNPTSTTTPLDTNSVTQMADELRQLKAYLQTQLTALGGAVANANWNAKYKNLIINGDFAFNDAFLAFGISDNWKKDVSGAGVVTCSSATFTPGQTAVPDEPAYYMSATPSGVVGIADYSSIDVRIENVRTLAGKTCTLTFYASSFAGTPSLTTEFIQNFGTGGSADVNTIGVTKVALSTTWAKYTVSVAIPSLVGKTVGTDSFLAIKFWLSAGSNYNARNGALGIQTTPILLSHVQLEEGGISTPFEYRNPATEQELINRYLQVFYIGSVSFNICQVGAISTTSVRGILNFKGQMRRPPTVTQLGAAADYTCIGGTTLTITGAPTFATSDYDSVTITVPVTGATVGQSYLLGTANSNATIYADARL